MFRAIECGSVAYNLTGTLLSMQKLVPNNCTNIRRNYDNYKVNLANNIRVLQKHNQVGLLCEHPVKN